MPTVGTRFGFLQEERSALLAAPADPHTRLAPDTLRPLVGRQNFSVSLRVGSRHVSRVAAGPLLLLCRIARAFSAAGMLAVSADGGSGRDKEVLALVARPADTLLRRATFKIGTASTALDGQVLALLGGLGSNLRSGSRQSRSSRLPFLGLALRLLFLGRVARALLAARMLALLTDTVRTKGRLAAVTLAVDTHADGLLNTLHVLVGSASGDPFVRLKSQAILGEEGTSTLLLGSIARVADLAGSRRDGSGLRLRFRSTGNDECQHVEGGEASW